MKVEGDLLLCAYVHVICMQYMHMQVNNCIHYIHMQVRICMHTQYQPACICAVHVGVEEIQSTVMYVYIMCLCTNTQKELHTGVECDDNPC
jgi:hypothetical protein